MKAISTDPDRWIGFTNDRAEAEMPTFWIRMFGRTLYVWGDWYVLKGSKP